MKLKIVTPYGTTLDKVDVQSVTVPTKEGVITVMDEHIPILYMVVPGVIELKFEDGTSNEVAISKGVIEVLRDNVVNIMADTAERAEQIDVERAEEARMKAEEFLKNQKYEQDVDFAAIQSQLEKEMARLSVARKYKNVGGTMPK
jgi:F-type H+-transporting ATPase subunit epsilon